MPLDRKMSKFKNAHAHFCSRGSRRAGRSGLPFVIGTDVGGTFTDLWIASGDGETRVFKSPTTKDVLGGVIDAMHMAAKAYGLTFEAFCADITRFGHGTTVGLNALLTATQPRKHSSSRTKGFGDTLEIGRAPPDFGMNEFEMTDAFLRNRHPPLAPRSQIIEVDERIDANGNVMLRSAMQRRIAPLPNL